MWTLTGFADEISPDLDVQLDTLRREEIEYLEFRGVWNKNVLDLNDADIETVKARLAERSVKVSSIGSPIGKIAITDDFAPHLVAFKRALRVAQTLEAPYIRIFSFFMPADIEPERYRQQVLDRLGQIVRLTEGQGVTLLHENEKHIYGDTPQRCHDILNAINSPLLRAAWDPANFVQCDVRPFTEGFALLQPFIAYIHVKDALQGSGEVVPAGEGDGQWPATIAALKAARFDGFFSLEPHLQVAGPSSGFTGPDLLRNAAGALKGLFQAQGVRWR